MRGGSGRLIARARRAGGALLLLLVVAGGRAPGLRAQVDSLAPASAAGEVRDIRGPTLAGATILLVRAEAPASGRVRITDADGAFSIQSLLPGAWRIRVSLPGYRTVDDTLHFAAGDTLDFVVALTPLPIIPVDPIDVSVEPAPGPFADFERRRLMHQGTFFDREDIEAANVVLFTDLMRTVPGVRIVPIGRFGSGVVLRGGCRPELWLDGAHVGSTTNIDDVLKPHAVEAVEVYRSANLPPEFGSNQCGAIIAWTRRGDPHVERKSLARQFVTVGVILLGFLLIHR